MCAYPHLCMMFVSMWVENGCGLMDITVGAFPLIEALVYMPIIDIYLPILVSGQESIPNQISQFGIHIQNDGK